MDRISVPLLGVVLSHPLPVIALVSSYLTNKLIGRRPIPFRLTALPLRDYRELPHLSMSYAREWGMFLRVTNPSAGPQELPEQTTALLRAITKDRVHFDTGVHEHHAAGLANRCLTGV